jgi:uncharacterized protein (TIGR00661 family)
MRLAYGVNGYGRGHAMRAAAVLPHLRNRHDILVFAGGDAFDALQAEFPVQRVPNMRYYYRSAGKISPLATFKRNIPLALDLFLKGAGHEMVADALHAFNPDLVVSDGEPYTLWAGGRMGVPRISFDNFAQLAYCRLGLKGLDRLRGWANGLGYRTLLGHTERIIIASFFEAPAKMPGICSVGAVMRPEVLSVTPTRGEHLLVYFSKPEEFTPAVELALHECGRSARIYGTSRRGLDRQLQYKPLGNLPFLEDLASCRAVFGTTGNQLLGEVIHFRKPMLAVPINCLEQRLNALQLERLGVGEVIKSRQVTGSRIKRFLAREPEFTGRFPPRGMNGLDEAVSAIERIGAELTDAKSGAKARAPAASNVRTGVTT